MQIICIHCKTEIVFHNGSNPQCIDGGHIHKPVITIKGKTQKGKNRVRELGDEWVIVSELDQVLFNTEMGPWFLIRPINVNTGDKDRWIHSTRDIDFDIVTV